MKVLEFDYRKLPVLVKIRGNGQTKTYLLKASSRKVAACLAAIDDGLLKLIPNAQ